MATNGSRPLIVAGTDGSSGSIKALRWALRQAKATGADVHVVLAWEVTAPLGYVATVEDVDWAGIAGKAVEEAAAAEPDVSVPISTAVVNDHPSNVLVEASKDADPLVVGAADRAAYWRCCSARSVTTAPTIPTARSWWSPRGSRTPEFC